MAHYAKDCWDAEVETSYGWIEIAGHADRSCFDLSRHSERTKTELQAARQLKEPRLVKLVKMTVNKKEIGKLFKQDAQPINLALEALTEDDKERYRNEMDQNKEIVVKTASGKELKLTADLVQFEQYEKNIQEVKYTPSVIEPSFGIGRIVYCIFEHCFKVRAEDEQRTYFVFPPLVAPLKCSILPLIDKPVLNKVVQDISKTILMQFQIKYRVYAH